MQQTKLTRNENQFKTVQIVEKTRAKSSNGTCDEVGRAKSQELIWYEL